MPNSGSPATSAPRSDDARTRRGARIAVACFVTSGFAGLVYEVCWIRMASLVFGSTTIALSTVLA
ncbi:MAG: hypothetical protein KDA25_03330, partial [Phycisphaerales bacterium]|nr:hypothetical protein [Phycisphaerales bacterium]